MMKYKNYWRITINSIIFGLLLLFVNSSRSEGNEALGKEIYDKGLSSNKVNMGDGFNVSAEYFPCANCHGRWGQGTQESGVFAPNITWQQLSKPYELKSTQGRKRQAYDLILFRRVLSTGVDSSGTTLSSIMPRYDYNDKHITALWESLKSLSHQHVQGVELNTLNIGVVLADKPYRRIIIKLLQTYFEQINVNGGIFQRQLRLVVDKTPAFKPDCCIVFMGYEALDFPQWALSLPRISIFSSLNDASKNTEYPLFALYPGAQHRLKILQEHSNDMVNSGFEWEIKPPGLELVTKRGQAEYLNLVNLAGIELQWISEQLWILSANKLLLHALNQIGRDVDSQKLINALTQTHDYHTHLGPPLSYGPQRFIGAQGIMIKNSIGNKWLWYKPEVSNQ